MNTVDLEREGSGANFFGRKNQASVSINKKVICSSFVISPNFKL